MENINHVGNQLEPGYFLVCLLSEYLMVPTFVTVCVFNSKI